MKGMMKCGAMALLIAWVMMLGACSFRHQMDRKFGDQDFKTTIALVEVYKLRHGVYPASLSDLHYLGNWDPLYLQGVKYRRLGNGYELDIERGWIGKPELSYPPGFWHGLGIVSTNVGGFPAAGRE